MFRVGPVIKAILFNIKRGTHGKGAHRPVYNSGVAVQRDYSSAWSSDVRLVYESEDG